jgi:hypothetical protein
MSINEVKLLSLDDGLLFGLGEGGCYIFGKYRDE